jgi:hypothetical protein
MVHDRNIVGGASMVKWTAPISFIGLSESDLKLYTKFDCEGKNHKHFKIDLQSLQKNHVLQIVFKKSLHILEHGASDVRVGDIE